MAPLHAVRLTAGSSLLEVLCSSPCTPACGMEPIRRGHCYAIRCIVEPSAPPPAQMVTTCASGSMLFSLPWTPRFFKITYCLELPLDNIACFCFWWPVCTLSSFQFFQFFCPVLFAFLFFCVYDKLLRMCDRFFVT